MNHPLDGARFKIVRAKEHLDSLKSEIRQYLDRREYTITVKRYANGQPYPHPVATSEPPLHLSAIIGDCLSNARASLDYIAWQLAVRYFADPALNASEDSRWVSFPIYSRPDATGLRDKLNRFSQRHVPAGAITNIRGVQPYCRGQRPLEWLHDLVNVDKHKMPHLTVTSFGSFMWAEIPGPTPMKLIPAFQHHLHTHPVTGEQVKVEHMNPVFVAFDDASMPDEPVDRTLEQIIETVANVIPRFDQFFA